MPKNKLTFDIPGLIADFQNEFRKKSIRTYASSTAFCMLMSVVPVLIVASAILPYTSLSKLDMIDFLMLVLPESSKGMVRIICDQAYRAAGGILPVSIIFMLWSSGFGMMQFARGINRIEGGAPETRNYFLLRAIGTLYALLFIALMVAVLFLQIFVGQLTGLWQSAFPGVQVPSVLTSALRYVVLFAIAALFLLLLFTTMPAGKKNPWQQLPGVLVGVIGCGVLNGLFALYVDFMPNLNTYYGSLTTIVVMMLWLYWSFYIILFGAFINRFIEKYILPQLDANNDDQAADAAADAAEGKDAASGDRDGRIDGRGEPTADAAADEYTARV